jgi:hypothetical protein
MLSPWGTPEDSPRRIRGCVDSSNQSNPAIPRKGPGLEAVYRALSGIKSADLCRFNPGEAIRRKSTIPLSTSPQPGWLQSTQPTEHKNRRTPELDEDPLYIFRCKGMGFSIILTPHGR